MKEQFYPNPVITKVPDANLVTNNHLFFKHPKFVFSSNYTRPEVYKMIGPSRMISFDTKKTKAAIVNTGGLCPGINNVIYELVNSLENLYDIDTIYGVQNGFSGIYKEAFLELNLTSINGIQHEGGSLLGTSREELNTDLVLRQLKKRDISQLYVIGGDGSHRAAHEIAKKSKELSVGCVPKTIDNDLPFIDASFGFNTAVEKACEVINTAYAEISGSNNCVGIVKLMGRDCGWIALHASMGSYNVDVCLIPEYFVHEVELTKYIEDKVKSQGHCLVVVAEGVRLGASKDAAVHLRDKFSRNHHVKYIDPTYIIRGVPANITDAIYCRSLAQSAVHACMSGYTDFTVGEVDKTMAILSLEDVVKNTNFIQQNDVMWNRFRLSNLQPTFDASVDKHNMVVPMNKKERITRKHST